MWVSTSRRDRTNSTVLIGSRDQMLLVDPAWEADELASLGREIRALGGRPSAGLATHSHFDHILWHPSFGEVPRWASAETVRVADLEREQGLAELGPGWPAQLAALYGRLVAVTGSVLPWDGPEVQLIEHDAHCPGHTAAWVPELSLLLAGDMLSDVELPLPSEAPDALEAYARGLDALAPYVHRAAVVIPGHGAPTFDGEARLIADLRYLEDVMAGRPTVDYRLRNAGMASAHAQTVALAAYNPEDC
ncbi:MAG TPA: MBL fold metallo-hydrolase [Mycobacteriales bacterium]|nr:MBL fold metallo-hydrolase [Mycobacteriales bacterium]